MTSVTAVLPRGPFVRFVIAAVSGATVVAMMPSATAAPDPCAASEVAKTIGSVATSTGEYLDEHPQTNQALTTLSRQQAGPQSLGALKAYFDANPQAGEDLQQLQQPLATLSSRCKLPLTLPQAMGLMQAAQRAPAGLPNASAAGTPGVATPAQAAGASPASQGAGALPGAAIAGLP